MDAVRIYFSDYQYNDMIMNAIASQITSVSIVCSTVCSGKVPRHDPPLKGPVTRKIFPFDDAVMFRDT